jgi:hypothetical protein
MPLPPLYKFLDVEGAKKTLGNRCFKHAKPSSFNDTEDLTVAGIFRESAEEAISIMATNLIDVILKNVQTPPQCTSQALAANVKSFQKVLAENPAVAVNLKLAIAKNAAIFDLGAPVMDSLARETITGINALMQRHRVLCVTTTVDSEKMWSGYTENHKGVALRIEGNPAKASKFDCFEKVSYFEKRPVLYDDVVAYVEAALFADRTVRNLDLIRKIIYSKTLEWSHENEYRLAIFLEDGEDWETLPYHPEEIVELYLGLAMNQADKTDISEKALAVNSKIKLFQMKRNTGGGLTWDGLG